MMSVNDLVEQIENLRDRLLLLQQHSDNSTLPAQAILTEAFEELHVSLEELQVTQEVIYEQNQQLYQQNQQLQAAYQDIAQERQRYQDLFEFAPDAYFVTDATGIITEANRAAASLLNMAQQSLVGKSLFSFIPEVERSAFESELLKPRCSNWIRDWETHIQPCVRQPIDVAVTVAAVHDSEGKLVALRWLMRDISTQKQLEKALQEKEHQYRLLAHHFPKGGVFLFDRDLRYLIADGEAVRASGFSKENVEGKTIWEVLPPESCAVRVPIFQAALAGVETFDELTYGGHTYTQHTLPVKNEQGEIIAGMVVAQDITESRQAEQERSQLLAELANKQQLLETILQQIPAGIVIIEAPSGQVIVVNERLKEIVRGPHPLMEQIHEYLYYQCFYPDGKPYASEELPAARSLLTGEVVKDEEVNLLRADNTLATLLINSAPILDPQGQIVAAVGICIDITERKLIETELQKAHQKLAFHVDNSPLAVIECDENMQITRWSSAAEKIFGWTSEEVLGKRPNQFRFVFEEDVEVVNDAIYRLYIKKEPNILISNRNYTKDGAVVYCEWYCSGLSDEFGRLESTLGLVLDVTDRQKAEFQRDRLLVKEQEARAQAEAANRVKDEFLAVLSHELRSPLNAILGWAQMLRTRNLNQAATAKAIETIERNARLQTQLIEDLLDVSRILRGKVSLSVNKINLVSIIESALDTTRLAAEAKSISLKFRILDFDGNQILDTQYPVLAEENNYGIKYSIPQFIVNGDQNRLQQVIWNLLSNAIKFTPTGGKVEVRLSLVEGIGNREQGIEGTSGSREVREWGSRGVGEKVIIHTSDAPQSPVNSHQSTVTSHQSPVNSQQSPIHSQNCYAEIAVSDTGIGIKKEFLPYVFEYFRQADGSTTRKYGGLGLGLAIVHHLVELHGGTVAAQSDGEGKGATFIIKLPLLKLEGRQQLEDKSQQEEGKTNINAALEGLQILVVEDDTDAREFLTVVLAQVGATVKAVASVSDAIAILKNVQPDVLVSDIGMPNEDGYALIRQVRTMEKNHAQAPIPAIALTAYAREEDRNQAISAGFQLHLAKPVNQTELIDAIANLAKMQKAEA